LGLRAGFTPGKAFFNLSDNPLLFIEALIDII
jgi:hypothetical protein